MKTIKMDDKKERYLRNELQTLSILGALGRSRTYLKTVSEEDKASFRNALRFKIDEISENYRTTVSEEGHILNIIKLSDELTSQFPNCLIKERFRIGIAQKVLNLYLKYLWCLGLIPTPPHCPFDSIVIKHLYGCGDLSWTSIDSIEDYKKLVNAAKETANGKSIAEWELKIWTDSIQGNRQEAYQIKALVQDKKEKGGLMNTWRETMTKYHNNLKHAVMHHSGEVLKTSQIKKIIEGDPSLAADAQFVFPSDHCINHTNKGACYCAMTEEAIFEKIRHGMYRVRNLA
jgi:hypothetical protein